DLPDLDVHDTFTGPEVTLNANDIEKFCSIVGNNDESFKSVRTDKISAPMDFAIVAGWQAIIKSIFPFAIVLKLVHVVEQFPHDQRSEANIVSVVNTAPGKVVKVKGHVYRDGKPVVEVVSAFLYRWIYLGAVKGKKASRQFLTCPTQVILPLSPNHGLFGNDGLYSESKISLETLFQRWASESWGEYLCLAGAVIGWTRGTTLMGPTNIVAHELESYGVRTFSAKEMAFNILGLMHPLLFSITQVEPIWADLNGGMDRLSDLAEITTRIRSSLMKKSDLRRAIARDNAADYKILNGVDAERLIQTVDILPRANFRFNFPDLETQETLVDFTKLHGLIDLEKVIVVTGSGEVGPWGSSRTRWEMEARGEFTIEGAMYPAFRLSTM
ncbi:hypothetical protein BT96DRAFT_952022, partial [Gymnopus androsaceus JB14]